MKVGKAIYNILSKSTDVQSNFPFNTTDYAPTGTDKILNGDFSGGTFSPWAANSNWSLGGVGAMADGTSNNSLWQAGVIEDNKSYIVTYTLSNFTQGSVNVDLAGTDGVTRAFSGASPVTYTEYIVAGTSPTTRISFQGSGNYIVTLSNVSVLEVVLTKIFPELAPPDIDAPYIVYSVVSNSPSETKNSNGDIDTANIEVYGFQDTYNKAVDLGVSVRAALDRKTGTYNTIEIQSTNYVNEQMDVNEARKLWAAIQDYSIRIKNI
tara:strand:+ start:612 stop:1406 length:795 start_codon:yes stop_codon:yes gene_type:complete